MAELIYEFRSYRLLPGKAPHYLGLLRQHGAAVVSRHLPMLGFWMTETGRLNTLHHLWAYADMGERAACRAALMADTRWTKGFVPEAFPLIQAQESRLMQLETGSALLSEATARRKEPVSVEPADGPVVTEALHGVSFGGNAAQPEGHIGSFITVSGEAPGTRVSLFSCDGTTLPAPSGAPSRQELMRPASFSPLR
ncbi:NIPSNAP family protein [Oceanicola sp. 502str15]|uniref:NIPSNAP family protein n=1 Tax=Oceanicola sp. 502str15 TaxID=2696061 RepID=UPI002094916C|nr:NIPSNAP family protein [Oceanicola sp. 502str15]MCO6384409.1 hypothetical protein [Oceanicola sp. 502str15]